MAIEETGLFGGAALSDLAAQIAGAGTDPVTMAAAAAGIMLVLMMFRRLRRRRAPVDAPAVDAPVAATSRQPQRQRATSPIDERFAALRLQTEEMDALAPPPRHFKAARKPAPDYQLRRR